MADRIDLAPNQKILFTGDSITDAGRREAGTDPLGTGYVFFAANLLIARNPNLNLNIINTGISGDTTRSLKWRWDRDCLQHSPDILSVMIGINDLWCCHDNADQQNKGVPIDEYEDNCRYMLENAKTQCDCQIVIMDPFMFCNDPGDPMFDDLQNYIAVVHRLAIEFDAVLVRLQDWIDKAISTVPSEKWSDDMVHPYTWAHAWISEQWLKATTG